MIWLTHFVSHVANDCARVVQSGDSLPTVMCIGAHFQSARSRIWFSPRCVRRSTGRSGSRASQPKCDWLPLTGTSSPHREPCAALQPSLHAMIPEKEPAVRHETYTVEPQATFCAQENKCLSASFWITESTNHRQLISTCSWYSWLELFGSGSVRS